MTLNRWHVRSSSGRCCGAVLFASVTVILSTTWSHTDSLKEPSALKAENRARTNTHSLKYQLTRVSCVQPPIAEDGIILFESHAHISVHLAISNNTDIIRLFRRADVTLLDDDRQVHKPDQYGAVSMLVPIQPMTTIDATLHFRTPQAMRHSVILIEASHEISIALPVIECISNDQTENRF